MNNAFARIGRTFVSVALAGGLSAVATFAASPGIVNITLPHSVEVGSTVLPSGNYTLTSMNLSAGDQFFLLRPEHGSAITLQARRTLNDAADATSVEFNTAGAAWHFEKLHIQGESTGYEFIGATQSEK